MACPFLLTLGKVANFSVLYPIQMPINFTRLEPTASRLSLEPRDIFMSLPKRDKQYGYPRDVQAEVWKQWFDKRNEKNTIIKMNTGSGKTVVGLAILQSCLNEDKGPAVYVVPDNYLVSQVCLEARKLGIRVASDKFDSNGNRTDKGEDDYFFKAKKAILVTNIHKLVNGKSIFGMSTSNNVSIGSIIIDDVHACLDTIEQQFTIRIESNHALYEQIMQLFEQRQDLAKDEGFYDIRNARAFGNSKLIPFWIWQDSSEDVRRILVKPEYVEDPIVLFNLPLLESNWKTCNCVISSRAIEITPKSIPIAKITSFEQANRRIFMSATIADDSVFVSAMGLSKSDLSNIITPEKANDLGERLILFPKHLNARLSDELVKQKLVSIAQEHNVVIIVPSFERVGFWQDCSSHVSVQVLSSRTKNIESGVTNLKNGVFRGLTILVNKYDGVDLPDEACRFLVLDGLPAMKSHYDSVILSMNPGDKRICREQMQKIEQGMGRGVRSNSDYCVVVLMGDNLADTIVNQGGDRFFSKATFEQYQLSRRLWEQVLEVNTMPSIQEVFDLAELTLLRNPGWIAVSKSTLASVEYDKTPRVDSTVVAIRRAFDMETIGNYSDAFSVIEAEKNGNQELDDKERGFLMQLMAEYRNFINPVNAQEILLSAQKLNNLLLRPITGIEYEKLQSYSDSQGAHAVKYYDEHGFSPNSYLIRIQTILKTLIFAEGTADAFENGIKDVASIIGIHSSRPEKEGVLGGPDNLWAINNKEFMVIECKNGVNEEVESISKNDCAQLLSSIQWFNNRYVGNERGCHPIMIHRVNVFDAAAAPDPRIRIITCQKLEEFKNAISAFAESFARLQTANRPQEAQRLLAYFKLNGRSILDAYTIPFKMRTVR